MVRKEIYVRLFCKEFFEDGAVRMSAQAKNIQGCPLNTAYRADTSAASKIRSKTTPG